YMKLPDHVDAALRQAKRNPEEVSRQLEVLRQGPTFISLTRPCTRHDGIVVVDEADFEQLESRHQLAARGGRLSSFIPASGASSRLFQTLLRLFGEEGALRLDGLKTRYKDGERWLGEPILLLRRLNELAVWPVGDVGDDYRAALKVLFEDLALAGQPKGLIPFHRYPNCIRTAVEEHLAECMALGIQRVHFTISDNARERFSPFLRPNVSFSFQHASTDTPSLDLEGQPVYRDDGSLLFRPGGHGALLHNLDLLGGDVVLIKNIDNVVTDDHREPIVAWRRRLVGFLLQWEEEVHRLAERAKEGEDVLEEAVALCGLSMPDLEGQARSAQALEMLKRPLRVCGMVANEGQAGGGPFWVGDQVQIVEGACIDGNDPDQAAIVGASTHFNPVDMVCSLRDFRGSQFALSQFADNSTSMVARKSYRGQPLWALELPGLWNGAMAGWLTKFVEIPPSLFNPVKTLSDLLSPAHRVQRS
ncbi:MAG: DUF4301 family protein, partial [Proteobacteria bacterium]|nr:DUF4301 family protein [Pseudomonadota bacterium]